MYDFDNMSREDLLKAIKGHRESLLRLENHPRYTVCPFCVGSGEPAGAVPWLKAEVKTAVVDEWRRDVTMDEYEAYVETWQRQYTLPTGDKVQ